MTEDGNEANLENSVTETVDDTSDSGISFDGQSVYVNIDENAEDTQQPLRKQQPNAVQENHGNNTDIPKCIAIGQKHNINYVITTTV